MDENGSTSPNAKRDHRSRSRSPVDRERRRESRQRSSRAQSSERNRPSRRAPATRRVYIANIPFECKWTEVKDLFREKVGDVSYVEFFNDESGKFRGCGIVELKDEDSAQKAIDVLHRHEFKGRNLVVKEDSDAERDKYGRHITRSSRMYDRDRDRGGSGDMGRGGVPFNTYGLSPQFLESLGISGPLTNKVFVANLDYKVTAKKLQEIFQVAGSVQNAELKTDKDGNSKGHGTVTFSHPVEAVQAISMLGGQKLYARTLSIRMDKYNEETDSLSPKLPSGLQGVGKGLGAGGQAIDINNLARFASGGNANIGSMGMSGNGSLGNMMGMGGMNSMGGSSGMGQLGMGLGGGGMSSDRSLLNAGLGGSSLSSAGMGMGGSGMGLSSAGSMGMGMSGSSMMGGGLSGSNLGGSGGIASIGGGLSSLGSSLGSSGLGLGMNSMSGSSNLGGGFNDYDRGGYDGRSGSDSYSRASDTIIVRNFPSTFTWQDLRDRFKEVGDVCYTEMKSRGSALVRFTSERDAQRAIERMNGIRIDGRSLEVQFY